MKHPETLFQIKLVRDLRAILPRDCLMTAFPSGGGGRTRGAILKACGLVSGMPDILFFYDGRAFGMELKKLKGGRISKSQIETHCVLTLCGVPVTIVRTLDDALAALELWEIPTRIAKAA